MQNDERRSSRVKRKAKDSRDLDFEVWPGLEQALRASTNKMYTNKPKEKTGKEKVKPKVKPNDKKYTPPLKKLCASKPTNPYSQMASSVMAESRRLKIGRITEPTTVRIGEGLQILGKVLVTSYLCRCVDGPDEVFTGPASKDLYPHAMQLLVDEAAEIDRCGVSAQQRKPLPGKSKYPHTRLKDDEKRIVIVEEPKQAEESEFDICEFEGFEITASENPMS